LNTNANHSLHCQPLKHFTPYIFNFSKPHSRFLGCQLQGCNFIKVACFFWLLSSRGRRSRQLGGIKIIQHPHYRDLQAHKVYHKGSCFYNALIAKAKKSPALATGRTTSCCHYRGENIHDLQYSPMSLARVSSSSPFFHSNQKQTSPSLKDETLIRSFTLKSHHLWGSYHREYIFQVSMTAFVMAWQCWLRSCRYHSYLFIPAKMAKLCLPYTRSLVSMLLDSYRDNRLITTRKNGREMAVHMTCAMVFLLAFLP